MSANRAVSHSDQVDSEAFSPVGAGWPLQAKPPWAGIGSFGLHGISLRLFCLVSISAAVYATVWEYSTRRYLKGFSDAIIPMHVRTARLGLIGTPVQKILDSLLPQWQESNPKSESILRRMLASPFRWGSR